MWGEIWGMEVTALTEASKSLGPCWVGKIEDCPLELKNKFNFLHGQVSLHWSGCGGGFARAALAAEPLHRHGSERGTAHRCRGEA